MFNGVMEGYQQVSVEGGTYDFGLAHEVIYSW